MKKKFIFILLLLVGIFILSGCQKTEKNQKTKITDWNNPESIDPFQENVSKFLDVDTREYFIKADEASLAKNYKKAAQYYLAVLRNNINDITALYNLSCNFGLMNKPKLSSKYLLKAVESGFTDFNYILQDSDFTLVKNNANFKQTLDSISFLISNLGEMKYIEISSVHKYRVKIPEDYNQNKKYPLVVGLHAYGGNQDQFMRLWKHFFIPQFIFTSPQAPYHIPIGQMEEYRWFVDESTTEIKKQSRASSDKFILDLISKMRKNYDIGNVYLLAFHDGSEIAMDLAVKYPKLIKGVVLLNARLDTSLFTAKQLKNANKIKIGMTIAEKDLVDRKENKIIEQTLKNAGFKIDIHPIKQKDTLTKNTLSFVEKWLNDQIKKNR